MNRLTVTLRQDEREALHVLSLRERRDMRDQAAILIRRQLEQAGLLPIELSEPTPARPAGQGGERDHAA